MQTHSIRPESPVIGISTRERAMMGLLKPNLYRAPESPAEKDLAGDAFSMMWKQNPGLVEEPREDRLVNHAVMDWAMSGNPDRSATIGNIPAATIASSVMWAGLTQDETIKRAMEKQKEAERAMNEAKDAEKELSEKTKEMTQGGNVPTPDDLEELADLSAKIQSMKQLASDLSQEAVKEVSEAKDHPIKKYAAAKIVEKAEDAGEKTAMLMKSWGIDEGINDPNDIGIISQMVNSKNVEEITKLFGRFKETALRSIEGVKAGKSGSVPQVMETKDVSKIFAAEIASMSQMVPLQFRLKKMADFVNRGLMGFQPLEDQKQSGSFLAYVDESGSIGNELCAMEKALMVGIARAVQDGVEPGRMFELYGFDTVVRNGVNDKDDWRNMLAWAQAYTGGGTSIDAVLKHAIARAKVVKESGIDGADIVLISDGYSYVNADTWQALGELKAELGTRLCYIHLGFGGDEDLKAAADVFVHVEETDDFGDMVDSIIAQVSEMIVNH